MTEYISKSALVAEIERRKKYYENIQMIKPVYESNIEDFNELLSFLDSLEVKEVNPMQEDSCDGCINRKGCVTCENGELRETVQEEPVSIWHDGCEIPKSGTNILMIRKEEGSDFPPIAGCFHGTNSRLDGRNWGYYNGFCYNEIEPPLKWTYIDDILNLSNVQRTIKDWKEESVSDDYKKARREATFSINEQKGYAFKLQDMFDAGANWKHEQMMKDAMEEVVEVDSNGLACVNVDGYLPGDKVRVYIFKEE